MRIFDERALIEAWRAGMTNDFIESEMRRYAVKQLEELKIRIHLFPADSKFLDATDALISEIKRKEVAK